MFSTLNVLDGMIDNKSSCISYLLSISLHDYISLSKPAYENEGAIDGQRTKLTSKSAIRIREQMSNDFAMGAVLPAVVIGIVDDDIDISEHISKSINENGEFFRSYIEQHKDKLCIIDGMQRTTAMLEALVKKPNLDPIIRIELWVSKSISQLIYRMLVLNTGQVPWTIRRQLEVVLQPILVYLKENLHDVDIITSNESSRRSNSGEFQAHRIIESFLIFGTRTEKVSSKDIISDEYTKLDFIESSSKTEILGTFTQIFNRIIKLDHVFSKVQQDDSLPRFKKGIDIFTSQPALAGATAAFAQKILGRPKVDYSPERQEANLKSVLASFDNFLDYLDKLNPDELSAFLSLNALNEYIPANTSSKVGDLERSFFKDAFNVLISENFELTSMDVCWGN